MDLEANLQHRPAAVGSRHTVRLWGVEQWSLSLHQSPFQDVKRQGIKRNPDQMAFTADLPSG